MEDVGLFLSILSILRPFGTFCGRLVYFMVVWYIFPVLGKKSGNPCVMPG
jgi:hypothetical protein